MKAILAILACLVFVSLNGCDSGGGSHKNTMKGAPRSFDVDGTTMNGWTARSYDIKTGETLRVTESHWSDTDTSDGKHVSCAIMFLDKKMVQVNIGDDYKVVLYDNDDRIIIE